MYQVHTLVNLAVGISRVGVRNGLVDISVGGARPPQLKHCQGGINHHHINLAAVIIAGGLRENHSFRQRRRYHFWFRFGHCQNVINFINSMEIIDEAHLVEQLRQGNAGAEGLVDH